MSNSKSREKIILGNWLKIHHTECSRRYPARLEFRENGVYLVHLEDDDTEKEHPIWDGGEYEIISEDQIKISTANDAKLIYNFSVSKSEGGRMLIFLDSHGCKFRYIAM
ncbi:MAG: hypothetical protein M3275_09425 [Thermoproteota archaeon]|nr:hypothetical protein [Thermoproteota archaeon]